MANPEHFQYVQQPPVDKPAGLSEEEQQYRDIYGEGGRVVTKGRYFRTISHSRTVRMYQFLILSKAHVLTTLLPRHGLSLSVFQTYSI